VPAHARAHNEAWDFFKDMGRSTSSGSARKRMSVTVRPGPWASAAPRHGWARHRLAG
jgi:hypothetical protein